jgi:hypothetical protein
MKEGRARRLAELKAEGKPVPFGRKKGGRNRSREEREQAAWEKQCAREWRDAFHQSRDARKLLMSKFDGSALAGNRKLRC